MSWLALTCCLNHCPLNGRDRHVGIELANLADDEGRCWPSYKTLVKRVGAGETTIRQSIRRLEKVGWLVTERHGGTMGPSGLHTNLYMVPVAGPTGAPAVTTVNTPDELSTYIEKRLKANRRRRDEGVLPTDAAGDENILLVVASYMCRHMVDLMIARGMKLPRYRSDAHDATWIAAMYTVVFEHPSSDPSWERLPPAIAWVVENHTEQWSLRPEHLRGELIAKALAEVARCE